MLILETLLLIIVLSVGAVLLSYGAELFAERYGAVFVGSVVLALITTMPEYMFVIRASQRGEYHMALGSAVGACVLLITLGYGLVILFATVGCL